MNAYQAQAALMMDMAERLTAFGERLTDWNIPTLADSYIDLAKRTKDTAQKMAPELFKPAPVIQELYEAPEIPRTAPEPMPGEELCNECGREHGPDVHCTDESIDCPACRREREGGAS